MLEGMFKQCISLRGNMGKANLFGDIDGDNVRSIAVFKLMNGVWCGEGKR